MSANLAIIGGDVAMVYDDLTPWHRMGRQLSPDARKSVRQTLIEAKLDYHVDLQALSLPDGTQSRLSKATVRLDGDTAYELGTVGKRFRPIQNADAFSLVDDILRETGGTIRTAGALGHGETAWLLVRLGEGREIIPGETVLPNFLLSNGHDGTRSLTGRLTPVDVVCANTLGAAESGRKADIRIQHSTSAADRIAAARRLVNELTGTWERTVQTYQKLATVAMDSNAIRSAVETLFPLAEDATQEVTDKTVLRRAHVLTLMAGGKGARERGNTAWGFYNAVTEYVDHVIPAIVARDSKSENRKQNAITGAIFGPGNDLKTLAMDIARRQLVAA